MMQEFKAFALKGNVVDMAVGVIIGAAFGKIVSSLVADVLMPPIGLMMGKVSFGDLYVNLGSETYANLAEATKAGAPVMKYGAFLQTVFDFLIVAFVIFLVIRQMNKLMPAKKA
ncbi:MAG: large conductance mechanosensitive channel protein MscL [Planctomycetes bacterium]|nr:large conductance mechanosensitive channel protein MscL [Planctomycetota bacterium]